MQMYTCKKSNVLEILKTELFVLAAYLVVAAHTGLKVTNVTDHWK
jgi:hypothetical protein